MLKGAAVVALRLWQELTNSDTYPRVNVMKGKIRSMNISLPETLRERLEEKLVRQAYGSASEYVRQLIRQDLERDAREKVEALLLKGVHAKRRIKVTPEWWQQKEARIHTRPRRVKRA